MARHDFWCPILCPEDFVIPLVKIKGVPYLLQDGRAYRCSDLQCFFEELAEGLAVLGHHFVAVGPLSRGFLGHLVYIPP
jgi:hypothetical protein